MGFLMVVRSSDPRGHYAALGVDPSASPKAIKDAWRQRVKRYHPDHDPSPEAARVFQDVQEAWRVLSDPITRAEYDTTGIPPLQEDGDDSPSAPLTCSVCGVISAQPRYVLYPWVRSFLLWAQKGEIEGVFCRTCGDRAAARASTLCWAHGLWSLPGLAWTPVALWHNLIGGIKPPERNARLLIRQARAFLAWDEVDIARSLVQQARRFAVTPTHKRQIEVLQEKIPAATTVRRVVSDGWEPWRSKSFLAQLLPILALPLLVAAFALGLSRPWEKTITTSGVITVAPPQAGEIRHVVLGDTKLRDQPSETAAVLRLLDRFTTVETLGVSGDGQWVQIHVLGRGQDDELSRGWLPVRALYAGAGEEAMLDWCRTQPSATPSPGEILMRRAVGQHRAQLNNDSGQDAVVKLKSIAGATVVAVYIPATYSVTLNGVPEGTWLIEYATGNHYSTACHSFLKNGQAWTLPYKINLRPMPLLRSESLNISIPEINLLPSDEADSLYRPLDIRVFRQDE